MAGEGVLRPGEGRGSRRTPLVQPVDVTALRGTRWAAEARPEDMAMPSQCASCNHVFDVAKVTVTARYADCSMWKCPNCRRLHDSRHAWSGAPGARMGYTDLTERRRALAERGMG